MSEIELVFRSNMDEHINKIKEIENGNKIPI